VSATSPGGGEAHAAAVTDTITVPKSVESFLDGQVTLSPPKQALAPTLLSSTALKQTLAQDQVSRIVATTAPATVEYGNFSDNFEGTVDPATGIKTLTYQSVPAYFVIHRGVTMIDVGRRFTNQTVVTVVDAKTGKALTVWAEGL
jgi:hypothetical protein